MIFTGLAGYLMLQQPGLTDMKKIILLSGFSFYSIALFSQSGKEVKWTYTSKKIAPKTYELHMTAEINGNWHMYSQQGGDGPVSTSFTFSKNPLIVIIGKPKEIGKMIKKYEEAFGSDVRYYEGKVEFVQVVKLKNNAKTNVSGHVEFMVCNDYECLPPDGKNFSIVVGK